MRDISLENSTLEKTAAACGRRAQTSQTRSARQRTAEQLRFRLKEAMAQRGSSEAFLHWLSTDGGKHA